MDQEYVALRLRNGRKHLEPNVRSVRDRGAMFGAPPLTINGVEDAQLTLDSLEIEHIPAKDIGKVHRDGTYFATAEKMPIALVAPEGFGPATASAVSWGIEAVSANNSPFTGAGVSVAILDTGIEENHPAFQGVNFTIQDFTGTGPGDAVGHGTHCAGTILGRSVDGVRIGVAPGITQAYIAKVIGGDATTATLIKALAWAAKNEVDVISMSLGIDYPGYVARREEVDVPTAVAVSQALVAYRNNLRMLDSFMELLKTQSAFDEGSLVCAASGNESKHNLARPHRIACAIPAATIDVISVGALGRIEADSFGAAAFSNIDPTVCAPGVGITSANVNGGLKDMSGTSMACPHVAGVTALWWQAMRSISPRGRSSAQQVTANLLSSVRREQLLDPTYDPQFYGLGLVTAPMKC